MKLTPGSRAYLLNLNSGRGNEPRLLASACKPLPKKRRAAQLVQSVEGVGHTPTILLLHAPKPPPELTLAGQGVKDVEYSAAERRLRIRFQPQARPRELIVQF